MIVSNQNQLESTIEHYRRNVCLTYSEFAVFTSRPKILVTEQTLTQRRFLEIGKILQRYTAQNFLLMSNFVS